MRTRVTLALFLAMLLMGGATWMRFAAAREDAPQAGLISAGEPLALEVYNEDSFLASRGSASSSVPVTETGLIARSLVIDYVNLATSGEATPESIKNLADKYAEKIPTLAQAKSISLSEVATVPNTPENLQTYENTINQTHREFSDFMIKAYSKSPNINTLGPEFYSFVSDLSTAYTDTADKLHKIPVPFVVARKHVELVNKYLSSAEAMKALSQAEEDSTIAFAGLVTMQRNIEEEKLIVSQIEGILTQNGI